MARPRTELHEILVNTLGSENVYFQPPEGFKLRYPCILYTLERDNTVHADNSKYYRTARYDLVLIDYNPDSPIVDRLRELPYASFDRSYTSDNLNHFSFTIYF